MKEHQKELHHARQERGLEKYNEDGENEGKNDDKKIKKFESYKREDQLPKEVARRRVSRLPLFPRGEGADGRSTSTDWLSALASFVPDLCRRRSPNHHPSHQRLRDSLPHQHHQERLQERGGRLHLPSNQLPISWSDRWKEGGYGESFPLDLLSFTSLRADLDHLSNSSFNSPSRIPTLPSFDQPSSDLPTLITSPTSTSRSRRCELR